jgi:hypothetical protein
MQLFCALSSNPNKRATFKEPRVSDKGFLKTLGEYAGKMSLVGRRSRTEMPCSSATAALHELNAT